MCSGRPSPGRPLVRPRLRSTSALPPSLSRIPDQTLAQDSAVTVRFTITGVVIAYALQVSVSSSNATLLPVAPSTLSATCQQSGVCTLTIRPNKRTAPEVVGLPLVWETFFGEVSYNVTIVVTRDLASAE